MQQLNRRSVRTTNAKPRFAIRRGTCRHCGCQDLAACSFNDGTTCSWADKAHTICTSHSELEIVQKAALTGKAQ